MGLLLSGAIGPTGAPTDVLTDGETGRILATGQGLTARPGDATLDATGMVVLPAPAEPHAHLDKALSAEEIGNPVGDLGAAILAWHAHWPDLTQADILSRARQAAHELIAHGTTAIRSHADVGPGIGMRAVHALTTLRDELAEQGLADMQVCALICTPLSGPDCAPPRALLAEAIEAGVDVIGGVPHLDPDPAEATRVALEIADAAGLPIDLHTDETLDADVLGLPILAGLVESTGFAHGASAGHCCSLGVQAPEIQADVAGACARAGVAVIALPQTNLFLQSRGVATAPARGITAVRALLDAGATLAAGADNVRDPFNRVGRNDALETASLLVMAAHLTPEEAWHAVCDGARSAMGLEPVAVEAGAPAELLAVRGRSLGDAIARGSEHRIVIHRGRLVARTTLTGGIVPAAHTTTTPTEAMPA